MSRQTPVQIDTFVSGAATAANVIVVMDTSNEHEFDVAANATTRSMGVAIEKSTASGQPVPIVRAGTAKVIAGGTIAIGDLITADASGHGIATTTVGNYVVGRALQAGVDNDLVEVDIHPDRIETAL